MCAPKEVVFGRPHGDQAPPPRQEGAEFLGPGVSQGPGVGCTAASHMGCGDRKNAGSRGGDRMRFATKPHPVDGGPDRHACTMDPLGVLKPAGASWLPRTMQATYAMGGGASNGEGATSRWTAPPCNALHSSTYGSDATAIIVEACWRARGRALCSRPYLSSHTDSKLTLSPRMKT